MIKKIKTWLEEHFFWLKTGNRLHIANNGESVDEVVIKYKDLYFSVMLDAKTGTPTGDFGWSDDATMFGVPIREQWVASPTNRRKG